MDAATRLRRLLDDPRRLIWDDGLPAGTDLPRWLAPLPEWLENFGLNIAWLVVVINLVGTAFGFWYYGYQFGIEPTAMWPLVPDSPVATLFIALSLALWKLGRSNEYVNALAFFGCLKLGLWTPYVLLAFKGDFSYLHWAMYNFLFWSHLAMVVEAFLIQRYAEFPTPAVLVAVGWYALNDLLDYFVPIVGTPHHTLIPAEPVVDGVVQHVSPAHEYAAAGAVLLTVAATFLALATRVAKLERGVVD
ncbi:DUF1405 domain-containing protein [Haloferax volcanii]|uniref:DUF1405 domain-containing protein n=3 Tax=Haloferax volcanii TaxID=2246 RepID=A0A384L933_HALVD|nr:DUF1405 domain-containing protein [Haloferax volcanii]ADE02561.1 DUF1405 family protein [Haloferax volcanii DS2]ELY32778.1 hypothetical protein C498_06960 [Haloferax volcanii DS2]MBS8120058.1 DUF1405 domain-containing protein [Haloferax volcanii]MBS8125096.1 DUF1405 domain-containing protein [Haloferax volcanii]MBS8128965.1 DUF1405 domain-containing protein [Haloferax volcanii]